MIELIVNDISLDLSESSKFGLSVLSSDITQLNQRFGDFTNTFSVPATKRNVQALENVTMMTTASNIPYRIVRATYLVDGIEVVSNGYCVINSVDANNINLNIFSGNTDFFKDIDKLTVADLYEDEESFSWSQENVVNGVDDVVFPIIKWRENQATYEENPTVSVRDLLPCLKFNKMLEKLSDKTGWLIGGDFDRNVLITPNEFKGNKEVDIKTVSFDFDTSWDWKEFDLDKNGVIFESPNITVNYASNGLIIPLTDKFGRMLFSGRIYWSWRAKTSYFILQQRQEKDIRFRIRIKDNLGNTIRQVVTSWRTQKLSLDIDYLDLFAETSLRTFVAGREYSAEVFFDAVEHTNMESIVQVAWHTFPEPFPSITSSFEQNFAYFPKLQFTSNESLVFGNEIFVKNLFTMKVVDVIKEVINSYQVIVKTDSYLKAVEFNYLNSLIDNKGLAPDWSGKIIGIDSIGFVIPNMARINHLRYKHNDTLPNDADSFFTIENENISEERNYVQLQSEMTETYTGYNDELVCQINGLNSERIWQNPPWRIIEFENISTPFDVTFRDFVVDVNVLKNENIYFARFRNFEFLKDNFFNVIQEISINTKVLTAKVKILPTDLQLIRGKSVPVWVYSAKYNIDGYFHVNKLENYQNGMATVELIRI